MAIANKPSETMSISAIPARVAALREVSEHDPVTAQDAAWCWLQRLGKQVDENPAVLSDLDELLACGRPAPEASSRRVLRLA